MAKADGVGVIERHIEKMVLAVCLALLAYAIAHWAAASPRMVEVPQGYKVPPSQTDAAILRGADLARKLNDKAKAPPYTPPGVMDKILALRGGPTVRQLAYYVPGRPAMKSGVETLPPGKPVETSLARLAQLLPAPSRPSVRITRELPQTGGKLADVDIARPLAVYPLAEATSAWRKELAGWLRVDMIVLAVEAEVQVRQPGMSWQDAPVLPVKPLRIPIYTTDSDGKEIRLDAIPTVPRYTGKNTLAVRAATDRIADLQEDILQPKYWLIWHQSGQWGDWRKNLPQAPLKDIGAKLAELQPSAASSTARNDRPLQPNVDRGRGSPRNRGRDTERRRRLMKRTIGRGPGGADGLTGLPGGGPTVRPRARGRDDRNRRGKEREKRRRDAEAKKRAAAKAAAARAAAAKVAEERTVRARQVPGFQSQLADGKVLVWMHDTSVKPGVEYKYRIRLKLLNPLLTHERELDKSIEADAFKTAVATPWSKWSDAAQVPHATELFLTGSLPSPKGEGKVRVTVFTRALGQRVSQDFYLTRGQAIGSPRNKTVMNHAFQQRPRGGSRQKRLITKPVDFSTGAVVVAIDFNKKILRNGITQPTVEMKYLDRDGILRRCIFVNLLPTDDAVRKRYELLKKETEKLADVIAASRGD